MWPNEPSLLSIQMHNSMLSKPLTPSKNSFCRNDIHFLDLTAIKAEISVISVPVCVSKPEASMSLISTRKRSSGIWASVWRNTVPIFFTPTFIYNAAMSLCRQGLQQTQSREKKNIPNHSKQMCYDIQPCFACGSAYLLWGHWFHNLYAVWSGKPPACWGKQPVDTGSASHSHQLQPAGHYHRGPPVYDWCDTWVQTQNWWCVSCLWFTFAL